jgi:hypothetical protein
MMGIDFMLGGFLLSLLTSVTVLLFAFVFYRLATKLYQMHFTEEVDDNITVKWEVSILGFLILSSMFLSSAVQPKLTIETQPDRDLIIYQDNKEDVVINTPEPRTENLEGFAPLKKD